MACHYNYLKIPLNTKTLVFSDGLDVKKAIEIKKHCDQLGIKCSFGIGTNFTNDYPDKETLNIVIKLVRLDGVPVVKLSDVSTKTVCEDSEDGRDALRVAKNMFLNERL